MNLGLVYQKMKYFKALILTASVLVYIFSQVCLAQSNNMPKQAVIQFSRDRVIELAFTSFNMKKIDQIVNDYFPKVMPIVFEYGGKPLMGLQTVDVPTGSMRVQRIGFFEWPSVEVFRKIVQDPRVLEIIGIRNDALIYINESNFFTVAKNVRLQFDASKIYQFMAVWMKSGDLKTLDDVSQTINSIVHENGGTLKLELLPVDVPDGDYHPSGIWIYEWASVEKFQEVFQFSDYQSTIASKSIEKTNIILTTPVFF